MTIIENYNKTYFIILKSLVLDLMLLILFFLFQIVLIYRALSNHDSFTNESIPNIGFQIILGLYNGHSGIHYTTIIVVTFLVSVFFIYNFNPNLSKRINNFQLILSSLLIGSIPILLFFFLYYFIFVPFFIVSWLLPYFTAMEIECIFNWWCKQPLPMDEFGVILLALVVSVSTIFIGHRLKLKVTHGVTTVTSTN